MAVTFNVGDKDYVSKLNQMSQEFASTEDLRNEVVGVRNELIHIANGTPLVQGDYGVGSNVVPTINDLTQDVPSGFYKFRADYPGAPEINSNSTLWYTGFITKGHGNRVTYDFVLVTGGTPRKFTGERIGTTGEIRWREIHADITETVPGNDVENIPDVSGFYAIEASSGILNFPETGGNWQFINLNRSSTSDGKMAYSALLAVDRDTGKMYTGSYNAARAVGDKFRWGKVFTDNNSVNPLDYGLGTSAKFVSFSDWNDLLDYKTGFYSSYQANRTSIPNSPPFFSNSAINTLIEVKREGARCVVVVYETKIGNISKFERVHGGTVWGSWREDYHSGNTSFNEFGGPGNWIMEGIIVNTSGYCRFSHGLNSKEDVTGTTIEGSFKIVNLLTGAEIMTGVTSLNTLSVSSARLLVLGTTLSPGTYEPSTPVALVPETGSSKLTVNF